MPRKDPASAGSFFLRERTSCRRVASSAGHASRRLVATRCSGAFLPPGHPAGGSMRVVFPLLIAFACQPVAAADDAALAHANDVLAHTILFDGHNDLPWAVRTDEAA